jgi:secretion/DNA translocation related TadE-like protein
MVILWSAVSTARHKLAAAADLTALSAAQVVASGSADPCATARRIATTYRVELADCRVTEDTVSIRVTKQVELAAVARPTLSAQARAGPA